MENVNLKKNYSCYLSGKILIFFMALFRLSNQV